MSAATSRSRWPTCAISSRDSVSPTSGRCSRAGISSSTRTGERPPTLERLLEAEAEKRLALKTDFFVRTAKEWEGVVAHNPFRKEAMRDPGHLVVMFLKDAPSVTGVKALQKAITGREVVRAAGKHLYIVYPDGIGRSRLTNALIDKQLGTRGTGRNWNTVLKLAALAAG